MSMKNKILKFTLISDSEEETKNLAIRLSPFLCPEMVLLLKGPIGSGKSVFARAIISTLLTKSNRQEEDIPSPTFTLVQCYQADEMEIWHVDLYRIEFDLEIMELGLEEAFETSLCIIEWGEKLGRFTPDNPIEITIEYNSNYESRREITITTKDSVYHSKLEEALG